MVQGTPHVHQDGWFGPFQCTCCMPDPAPQPAPEPPSWWEWLTGRAEPEAGDS